MLFEIVDVPPQPFAYLHKTAAIEGIGATMADCFQALGRTFGETGVVPAGPPLTYYTAVQKGATTFDVGFPVKDSDIAKLKQAGLEVGVSPSGRALKAVHTGPYETLHHTYEAMQNELARQNLRPGEAMWEVYMSPPETPPQETVTEVYWPIA